jgi:2-oxo-3-hexenedioate decarboxylase/2-keto-4-pentenoate hydratase
VSRDGRAAALLAEARLGGTRLAGLPEDCRPRDAAQAYAVQLALHARLTARGLGPLAGHKIGCTTPVMQRFLGIDSPCAGGIFAATIHRAPAALRFDGFRHVGVECEIAVRLDADLPAHAAPFTAERVAPAVGACMAAIEVVDDRWVDYKTVDTPSLIADDFFNAACVLGPPVEAWRTLDLTDVLGITRINGAEVGRGRGADVMGHPLAALAWLANHLAARDLQLGAGDVVLTGSVVETRWAARGDTVVVSLSGLGEARATFD